MANSYVTLPGKDTGITSSVRQVIRQLRHDFEQETGNEALFSAGHGEIMRIQPGYMSIIYN